MPRKSNEEITAMGMFDWVRCEVPLPDGFEGELQTKDFDEPFLLTHVITKEGRLMRSYLLELSDVPMEDRPHPSISSLRDITELRDTNFHGLFSFGHYVAEFFEGSLIRIRLETVEELRVRQERYAKS